MCDYVCLRASSVDDSNFLPSEWAAQGDVAMDYSSLLDVGLGHAVISDCAFCELTIS